MVHRPHLFTNTHSVLKSVGTRGLWIISIYVPPNTVDCFEKDSKLTSPKVLRTDEYKKLGSKGRGRFNRDSRQN